MEGYTQIYTGNGKGKTTAAVGLALRAATANLKIYFAQFIKSTDSNVVNGLKSKFSNIHVHIFGRHKFIDFNLEDEDKKIAQDGLAEIKKAISGGKYDLMILDEINIALHYGLISEKQVLNILENKPNDLELILTGRHAPKSIIQAADLVTKMEAIKHYFNKGVTAREGIEY